MCVYITFFRPFSPFCISEVKRDNGRAYQNFLAGITGPVFVPHIITVADGEVSHQISLPAEMCLITILPEQSWKFTSLNALV